MKSERESKPSAALLITGGRILTPFEEFSPADLLIRNGRIEAVGRGLSAKAPADAERIDAAGMTVSPGMIDLHTQGAGGYDVWDGTQEALVSWSRALAEHGTTSFQVTTGYRTDGYDFLVKHLVDGFPFARPLGVYLESPFCSVEKRGGISKDRVGPVSVAVLDEIQSTLGAHLHMMTVAPERENALQMIEELTRRGIIPAIGHTNCDYETALKAIDSGATHVTHCYNAMTAINHRLPGSVVAVLLDGRVTVELICDGIHLHPATIRMAVRLKGVGLACAVTDSMRVSGLPDLEGRTFERTGRSYKVEGGAPRLPDGTLAGSAIMMDEALRNVMKFTGLSLKDALPMVTSTPGSATRVDDRKGQLKPGFDADVIFLDEKLNVRRTIIDGSTLFAR